MDQNPPRYPVTCEIDGKTYRGTYWVAGKILTVSTGMGGKSKQVGSTLAEDLAKQLLLNLAEEGKAYAVRRHSRSGRRGTRTSVVAAKPSFASEAASVSSGSESAQLLRRQFGLLSTTEEPLMESDRQQIPWNKEKLIGQKPPLKLKEIWAIRVRLQVNRRTRDLALFNLAISCEWKWHGLA